MFMMALATLFLVIANIMETNASCQQNNNKGGKLKTFLRPIDKRK